MALGQNESEALFSTVNRLLGGIPSFLRGGLNERTLPSVLATVPLEFRRYTLQEIIETLEEGTRSGKIRF
jgi:hypothetical protein